jgi:hypothetical protein
MEVNYKFDRFEFKTTLGKELEAINPLWQLHTPFPFAVEAY